MNKKSAEKSRQYCERPIDSVKLIPRKVRKSPMPRYYLLLVVLTQEKGSHQGYRYVYFAKSTAIIRFDVYCGF